MGKRPVVYGAPMPIPSFGRAGFSRALVPLLACAAIHAQSVKPSELAPSIVGDVQGFLLSPDGGRVVYIADQDTDQLFELYSAPTDGSQSAVKLNVPAMAPGLTFGSNSPGFLIAPGGSR